MTTTVIATALVHSTDRDAVAAVASSAVALLEGVVESVKATGARGIVTVSVRYTSSTQTESILTALWMRDELLRSSWPTDSLTVKKVRGPRLDTSTVKPLTSADVSKITARRSA